MIVAYYSITGNVKRFVEKLGYPSVAIEPANPLITVNEPFIVIAPTYEQELTEPLEEFIEHNSAELFRGVIGSGNLNFADLYVFTAKAIAKDYRVPLLYAFEYSGTPVDVAETKKILEELT